MDAHFLPRSLVSALLLLALLLPIGYLQETKEGQAIEFFSRVLADAGTRESVVVERRTFEIREGAVYEGEQVAPQYAVFPALRLAYAKALARYSPLLALEGTDSAKLEGSIAELEQAQDILASLQSTPREAMVVRYGLYPIQTLRAFARAERARQTFLVKGDAESERRYALALSDASTQYLMDLKRFRHAFEKAVSEDIPAYVTVNAIITRDDTLGAVQKLDERMKENLSELRERSLCIQGHARYCDPHDPIAFTSLPVPPENASGANRVQAEAARRLFSDGGIPIPEDAPTVVLAGNACTENPSYVKYVSALRHFYGIEQIQYVGDALFISTEQYGHIPFFARQKERGAAYSPFSLKPYSCFDIGNDWGRVSALLAIRSSARRASLTELSELERRLLSDTLTEVDALRYLSAAHAQAVYDRLTQEMAREIGSLSLGLRNRSAEFDVSVASVAHTERGNAQMHKEGVPVDMTAPYLFFVRSSFLLLFLADNSSVTRGPISFFEKNTEFASQLPYLAYSKMGNAPQLRATLVEDIRRYLDFYNGVE